MSSGPPSDGEASTGRRASQKDLFELAQQRFLAGETLDMRDLAVSLGVSRATVYRWAGNRELLLGEVLWTYAHLAIEEAKRRTPGEGLPYLLGVIQEFIEAVDQSAPLHTLLVRDPGVHAACSHLTAQRCAATDRDHTAPLVPRVC